MRDGDERWKLVACVFGLASLLAGCAQTSAVTTATGSSEAARAQRADCRRRTAAMIEGDQALRRDPAPADWSGPGSQPAAAIATGDPCEPGAAYVDPETAERKAIVGVERARRFVEEGDLDAAIDALVPAMRAGRAPDRGAREVAASIEAALVRTHGPAPGGEDAPLCSVMAQAGAPARYVIAIGERASIVCRVESSEVVVARAMLEPGRYAPLELGPAEESGARAVDLRSKSGAQGLIALTIPRAGEDPERATVYRIFWFRGEPGLD